MTVYAITDTKKGEQGLRLLIFKLPLQVIGNWSLGSSRDTIWLHYINPLILILLPHSDPLQDTSTYRDILISRKIC